MADAKIAYSKRALSVEEHIGLLQSRGLEIPDAGRTAHYLHFVGYYRLSGYLRHFIDPEDKSKESFRSGASFEHALDLYVFDRKLRVLLTDALERIEIAFKAVLSNEGATLRGPFWLFDPANFDHGTHSKVIDEVDRVIGPNRDKHQHPFIVHFYNTYSDLYPPCWMMMEVLSFGATSKILQIAKGNIQKSVANRFGQHQRMFPSAIHALVFLRNLCAHNCRVWNRTMTITARVPRAISVPDGAEARLYPMCCLIQILMKEIADGSRWGERLKTLISEQQGISLAAMGFPQNWLSIFPWV